MNGKQDEKKTGGSANQRLFNGRYPDGTTMTSAYTRLTDSRNDFYGYSDPKVHARYDVDEHTPLLGGPQGA